MSFNTGGNVSKVQGEDLIARMIASSGTWFWTIVSTSLLLSGVMSVSPVNAAANEGVRMTNSPTASGKNAFFTANSFQSSRRQCCGTSSRHLYIDRKWLFTGSNEYASSGRGAKCE